MARLLLDNGADINLLSYLHNDCRAERTPLMQVSYKQQKGTAFLLLERGAGISITPRTPDGVLHCAFIMDSRHGPSRFTGQILGLLLRALADHKRKKAILESSDTHSQTARSD